MLDHPTTNTFWISDRAEADWLSEIKLRLFSSTKNEFEEPCVGSCLNIPRGYDGDGYGRRRERPGGFRSVLGNLPQDNCHQVEVRFKKDDFDILYGDDIHCDQGTVIKSEDMDHVKFYMRVDNRTEQLLTREHAFRDLYNEAGYIKSLGAKSADTTATSRKLNEPKGDTTHAE